MDTSLSISVDKIVAELEKISAATDKLGVPEGHKEFKPPAIHAAVKSLKCLVGELVGVVGLVTWLVAPVVVCAALRLSRLTKCSRMLSLAAL